MASTPSETVQSILLRLLQAFEKASHENPLSPEQVDAALRIAAALRETTQAERLLDRVNELSDRLETLEALTGSKDWSPPIT